MNVNCPNCEKQLKLGAKAEASISQMPPGKVVKVKCAQCDEAFGIGSDKKVVNLSVNKPKEPVLQNPTQATGRKTGSKIKPPEPPDLAWLVDGVFEDHEVVEEVPLALVMMNDSPEDHQAEENKETREIFHIQHYSNDGACPGICSRQHQERQVLNRIDQAAEKCAGVTPVARFSSRVKCG